MAELRQWEFVKFRVDDDESAADAADAMVDDGWDVVTERCQQRQCGELVHVGVYKRRDGKTPKRPRYPVWTKPWLGTVRPAGLRDPAQRMDEREKA